MSADQSAAFSKRLRDDKRDRLKQLRAFCHTARLGSITRAAERVFSSQPSVSLQVRALEDDLDVSLFERSGPRIALTLAGRKLYALAAPLVEDMDRLPATFAEQHEGITGELRLAAGETSAAFVLPRYLTEFRKRHPNIRATVRTGTGRQCLSWLRAYEVDLVFAAMDLQPADVEFRPVLSSTYLLITSEDHPLSGRESVTPEEVCAYPLIAHTSGTYIRQLSDMFLRQQGIAADIVVEVDGWEVIKEYVEAGLGIAFVPDLCVAERDRVSRIPFEDYLPPRRYGAITRRDRILPLAVRHFVHTMKPSLPNGS